MKKLILLLLLISLCIPVQAPTEQETRYCTTNLIDVYTYQKHHLETLNTNSPGYYEKNLTLAFGTRQSEYGVHIYKLFVNQTFIRLTGSSPEAIVIRTVDGQGLQSATLTMTETAMTLDALIYVEFWTRLRNIPFGGTAWTIMVSLGSPTNDWHQTEPLGALILPSAIWNFTYYTYRVQIGNTFTNRVWFGNSSHYTQIENFSYDTSTDFPIGIGGGLVLGGSMGLIVLLAVATKKKRR